MRNNSFVFKQEVEAVKQRLLIRYGDDNKYEELLKFQEKVKRKALKEFELEILNRMTNKEIETEPILRFLLEKIEKAYLGFKSKKIDLYSTLTPEQIYPVFHIWFRKTFPREPIISFRTMKEELLRYGRLGPMKNERWHGVKLRTN